MSHYFRSEILGQGATMSQVVEKKTTWQRWAWFTTLAILLTSLGVFTIPKALAADKVGCSGGSIQIIAHEDDDILFQSPDILRDVDAGRCIRSVFVTAGDASQGSSYWQSREKGAEAAWAEMAGVANRWTTSTISLAGKSVRLRTLTAAPNISLVFMRLPDGFPLGTGSASYGYQSLYRLLSGAISSISAVDGSNSYTPSTLRNALLDAVRGNNSTWIRTQDYVSSYGQDSDHYDHHSVAYTARDVMEAYEYDVVLSSYVGYGEFRIGGMWPSNVSGTDLDRKEAAFAAYSDYDYEIDWDTYWNYGWLQRQYVNNIAGSTSAANAGLDQEVNAGSLVTLDGSGSFGVYGLSYAWTQISGPTVALSSTTSATPSFIPLTAGSYTFLLRVTGGGATSTADVTVTVNGSATNGGTNLALAPGVTATASSETSGQSASAVRDGSVLGYPSDSSKEWATNGGLAGSWIQLNFPAPVIVDQVVLYDRPNSDDQVTRGTLTFSDNSTVSVGQLANSGATSVSVSNKVTTSIRFTINGVSSTTRNAGLAELQVFGELLTGAHANAGADQSTVINTLVTLNGSGSTGDALTYSWSKKSGPPATLSNSTVANPTFTPTQTGEYVFELTVKSGSETSTDTVTIRVASGNEVNLALQTGVSVTQSTQLTASPGTRAIDGVISGYPNDETKEWSTNRGKAGSWIRLTWPSAVTSDRIVLYDRPNSSDQVLSGTLTFSDGSSASVGQLDNAGGATTITFPARSFTWVQFTVNSVSSTTYETGLAEFEVYGSVAAVADAGPDQSVLSNTLVTLDGSKSSVPSGTVSYQWTKTQGPGATLSSSTVAKPTFTPTSAGTYVFQLTVSNGSLTATDTVTITVTAPVAPVANAGPDQTVNTGTQVTLDGSASSNPNAGTTLAYEWTQTGGTPVTLAGASTAKPTFTGAADGQYTFQLKVTAAGLSATDTVSVTLSTPAAQAPVANAGPDQSVSKGTTVTLDGTGTTNPNSGSTLSYQWTQTAGETVQLSNATDAKPTFTPTAAGSYTFRLTATSAGLSSTDLVIVTVSDAPPTPTNVARQAGVTVTQSSQATGQEGTKVIDGIAKGYPGFDANEWSTVGGKAGSWIKLTWDHPVTLSKVVLYDRPNTNDRVTGGTLVFSDNTSVPVTSLTNNGSATTFTFSERTVTSVQLNITSVSSATQNVGLAEFEAWGISTVPAANREPVANAGPDIYASIGKLVTLDGSASSDLDPGDSLSYAWTQTGGPVTVSLAAATTAKPTFTPTTAGTYVFDLSVSDGKASATDSVSVVVAQNASTNVARQSGVTVTQSSQLSTSQGTKAIDGVISGYPTDETKEWSTNGGKAGSWIKLAWSSPVTVNRIVLYDRPNLEDQVLSGTLTFSDGSTIAVGALDNAGGPTTITFDPKTITSVQFTVNSVSTRTYEVGLAEFEVFSS